MRQSLHHRSAWRSARSWLMPAVGMLVALGLACPSAAQADDQASLASPASPGDVMAPPGSAELDRALSDVLKRAPYQQWKRRVERGEISLPWQDNTWAEGFRDWLRSVGEWIEDTLDWLFNRNWPQVNMPTMAPDVGDNLRLIFRALGWLALALSLAAAGYLAWRYWPGLSRSSRRRDGLAPAAVRQAIERGEALALDADQWLDQARLLADAGETRLVYRTLYLGLLAGLHRRGRIDFRPHRTNWMYVAGFAGPDEERSRFGALTDRFDEVWYGLGTIGSGARGRAEMDRLRGEVSRLIGENGDG